MILKEKYTVRRPLVEIYLLLVTLLVAFIFFGVVSKIEGIDDDLLAIATVVAVVIFMITRTLFYLHSERFFDRYEERVVAYAATENYKYKKSAADFLLTPTLDALGTHDQAVNNVVYGVNWKLATYEYSVYDRNNDNKLKTIYYTIIRFQLPRRMPHFLFDSKLARRQQFKLVFDNNQRQQLEANFEKYFTSYFPKFYEIDGRSIIGPEVIEALIEAKAYDVEIIGDSLYLFSPLLIPEEFRRLINSGTNIYRSIENETRVYKDDRLKDLYDRDNVSGFGAHLRPNPYKQLPSLLIGLLAAALSAFVFKVPVYTVTGLLVALFAGGKILRSLRENKRLDKAHDALQKDPPTYN